MKYIVPQHYPPRGAKYSLGRTLFADLAGALAFLAVLWLSARLAGLPLLDWGGTYILLAPMFVATWHSDGLADATKIHFSAMAGISLVLGALFLGMDMLIGHWRHPELSLYRAAATAPGPFGHVLTLIVCPGMLYFAFSGWVRSLVLGR